MIGFHITGPHISIIFAEDGLKFIAENYEKDILHKGMVIY